MYLFGVFNIAIIWQHEVESDENKVVIMFCRDQQIEWLNNKQIIMKQQK